jgi:hypothetical protein
MILQNEEECVSKREHSEAEVIGLEMGIFDSRGRAHTNEPGGSSACAALQLAPRSVSAQQDSQSH